MSKKFSFWIWGAIILQWLTAAVHTVGQIMSEGAEVTDEKEKQLMDLMANFKKDYGAGFVRSIDDFVFALGICLTLFCIFGGLVDWWLKKKKVSADLWRGLLLIQVLIYAIAFVSVVMYTFIIPVVCFGLILLFSIGAYLSTLKRA